MREGQLKYKTMNTAISCAMLILLPNIMCNITVILLPNIMCNINITTQYHVQY